MHTHYETGLEVQVREHTISRTVKLVVEDFKRGVMDVVEAVTALRAAGCYEAEINEVLA